MSNNVYDNNVDGGGGGCGGGGAQTKYLYSFSEEHLL
jgi:hypothetical protein